MAAVGNGVAAAAADSAADTAAAMHGGQHPPERQLLLPLQLRVWQQQPCGLALAALGGRRVDVEVQALFLRALSSPLCAMLPPNVAYVRRLVRRLIAAAEDGRCELGEPLLGLQTALLLGGAGDEQEEGSWGYRTFYYSSRPSWDQLEELQAAQAAAVVRALAQQPEQQQRPEGDNAGGGGSALPAAQRRALRGRQERMAHLMAMAAAAEAAAPPPPPRLLPHEERRPPRHQQLLQAGLLSVHMSDNLFEGGTGCHMWDASFLLSEYVLNHPSLFEGKSCIEVGCGPGLVASCLCRAGAGQLLLTDGDPQTLVNCLGNLELNSHAGAELLGGWRQAAERQRRWRAAGGGGSLKQEVLACPLDWDEEVPGLWAEVVVGSDVAYDPAAAPSLVALLAQLLRAPPPPGAPPAEAYLATTVRQPETLALLLDTAAARGLVMDPLPASAAQWAGPAGPARGGAGAAAGGAPVVAFQELPAMDEPGRAARYVLHRVRAAGG